MASEPTGNRSPAHTAPEGKETPQGRFFSQTCASVYGGPSDPTSGTHGYKGDNLVGTHAFAELNMGTALGGLPYKTKIAISYKGRYIIAEKLDIGAGGPGCGGHARGIDLWWETAKALGFPSGIDVVSWQKEVSPAEAKKIEEETLPGSINLQKGVEEAVTKPLEWAGELGKVLKFLGSSAGWTRIGKIGLGVILIIFALNAFTKGGITRSAKKAGSFTPVVGGAVGSWDRGE